MVFYPEPRSARRLPHRAFRDSLRGRRAASNLQTFQRATFKLHLNPLECALTKTASANPLECALTKKGGGRGPGIFENVGNFCASHSDCWRRSFWCPTQGHSFNIR